MSKNWRVFIIFALIASLFVAGCGGGGEEAKETGAGQGGEGVEAKAKIIEEKVLEMESSFKTVADAYTSDPSTETLKGLVDYAHKQDEELTKLGVEAANLAAGLEAEGEAEPVDKAVEEVTKAKEAMEELSKQAETSLKALESKSPNAEQYLETVKGVKEAITAAEAFFAGGEGGGH